MPKLFDSPTQLIKNAIAFLITGLVIGFMWQQYGERYYSITIFALSVAIAWALYSMSLAPRLDLRPMTRVVMFIVGFALTR